MANGEIHIYDNQGNFIVSMGIISLVYIILYDRTYHSSLYIHLFVMMVCVIKVNSDFFSFSQSSKFFLIK